MSDALSKYFDHAAGLMAELEAGNATLVLVVGGKLGNGCSPALKLDPIDSADARRRNSRIVRTMARALEMVAARLEADIRTSGVPLEAPS